MGSPTICASGSVAPSLEFPLYLCGRGFGYAEPHSIQREVMIWIFQRRVNKNISHAVNDCLKRGVPPDIVAAVLLKSLFEYFEQSGNEAMGIDVLERASNRLRRNILDRTPLN